MPKVICNNCESEVEIPDDPRVGELLETSNKLLRQITDMGEQIVKLGGTPPPPPVIETPAVKVKKTRERVTYNGIFLELTEQEEYEE